MSVLSLEQRMHLEAITLTTQLGIRFWDPVRNLQIRDGLAVTARRADLHRPVVTAFRTASGIYAFQGLPGMLAQESLPRDAVVASSPLSTQTFVIHVHDRLDRFLPVVFNVDLPLSYPGVYRPAGVGSLPDDQPQQFYLFSAATRPVSSDLAAVRADLVDASTGQPAAHALLAVMVEGGEIWYGLSDARGRALVLFAYPPLAGRSTSSELGSPLHSPLAGSSTSSLDQQRWPLSVQVFYEPDHLSFAAEMEVPDLSTLFTQSLATIRPAQFGPAVDTLEIELAFGQEYILHTQPFSELWIENGAQLPDQAVDGRS